MCLPVVLVCACRICVRPSDPQGKSRVSVVFVKLVHFPLFVRACLDLLMGCHRSMIKENYD